MAILCKSPSSIASRCVFSGGVVDMLVSASRFCHPISGPSLFLGLAFCLAVAPAKSDSASSPFESPWTTQAGGAGQMRLVSTALHNGAYDAAVEIKLSPNAITYWRAPGEAGVPPVFSFEGSENVAHANVLYPVPSRLNEGGIEAFGYKGTAIFPIRVNAGDAAKPSRLALTLNYAICEQICIPAKGHVELWLPQSGDGRQQQAIAAAIARVPVPLAPADIATKVVVRTEPGQAQPQWTVIWHGTEAALDLFAEAPIGWAFDTRKTAENIFSLNALEMPSDKRRVTVHLTLAGATKSYEFDVPLEIPALTSK